MKKIKMYKGFVIAREGAEWFVFTAEEWSYGSGMRTPEFECQSLKECEDNIESY